MTKKQAGCRHGAWGEPTMPGVYWKHCAYCGEFLSLGKSSDDSAAVRTEIMAALFAAADDLDDPPHVCAFEPECMVCDAWRLAYEIVTHEEAP